MLEQQALLEGHHKQGASRRWKITVLLAVVGGLLISCGTVFSIIILFGVGGPLRTDESPDETRSPLVSAGFGYAQSVVTTGGAVFMLATLPADNRLVRFMSGFFMECLFLFAVVYVALVVRAHPVGACTANSCHPLTAFSVAFCAHQRFTGRRP